MIDEQVNNPSGHEFGKEAEKYISKLPGFLQQVAWNAFLTGASIGAKKYENTAAVNSITVGNINYTTDEQIKQNAEAYAEILAVGNKEHYHTIYTAAKEGYETGAHSRDKEIDRLNDKLSKQAVLLEERGLIRFSNLNAQLETENAYIKNQIEELSEQLKMNAENIQKHHNPWISVEDRLPERMTSRDSNGTKMINCCSKDVFGYDTMYNIGRLVCYNHESKIWESHDTYTIGRITHWMLIPTI